MRSASFNASEVIVLDDPWDVRDTSPLAPRRTSNAAPSRTFPTSSTPWLLWASGVLVTLVLHSLLLGSLMFGIGRHKTQPPPTEGFQVATQNAEATEVVSTLLLLNDESIHTPAQDDDSSYTAALKEIQKENQKSFVTIAAEALSSQQVTNLEKAVDTDSPTEEEAGDGAEVAMLFGRYMDQVKARIERAWSFPTAASKHNFQCKVQIKQSRHGDVHEVTLQRCDTDPSWQLSLVQAIQHASPLSAPPSEKVFSDVITLNFTAHAEVAAMTHSGSEIPLNIHEPRQTRVGGLLINPPVARYATESRN